MDCFYCSLFFLFISSQKNGDNIVIYTTMKGIRRDTKVHKAKWHNYKSMWFAVRLFCHENLRILCNGICVKLVSDLMQVKNSGVSNQQVAMTTNALLNFHS